MRACVVLLVVEFLLNARCIDPNKEAEMIRAQMEVLKARLQQVAAPATQDTDLDPRPVVSCPCVVGEEDLAHTREQLVVDHLREHGGHEPRAHTIKTVFHAVDNVIYSTEHPDFLVRVPDHLDEVTFHCKQSKTLKAPKTFNHGNALMSPQVFYLPTHNTYVMAVWKTGTSTLKRWMQSCGVPLHARYVTATQFRKALVQHEAGRGGPRIVSVYRDDPIDRFTSGVRTILLRNFKEKPDAAIERFWTTEGVIRMDAVEKWLQNTIVRDLVCTNYNFQGQDLRNLHIAPTTSYHGPPRFASVFKHSRPKWGKAEGVPDMQAFCFDDLIPLSRLNEYLEGMAPGCAFVQANQGDERPAWLPPKEAIMRVLTKRRPDLMHALCDVYYMDFACYGIAIPAECGY